jgi:nucleotide-binding universal stress UspA family protein
MNREQDYRPEDRQTARYQRILVATDGSECSVRAAAHAVYLAEALGARLYALYSVNVHRAFHMGIHFGGP